MYLFVAIAAIVLVIGFFSAITTKPYKKGSINNIKDFKKDVQNPYVTPKQLDKNIKQGKYR